MLKGLTGIHLVAKGPHGHCQENQGLSLLATAVMVMTCPMGFSILIGTLSPCQRPSHPNPLRHFGSPALKPFPGAQCACALTLAEMHTPVCTCPVFPGTPTACPVL